MTLEQLIDVIKATMPDHGITMRYDSSIKKWSTNIVHEKTALRDLVAGETKFPVNDRDLVTSLTASYSWASAWLIYGTKITEPDQFLIKS